MLAHTSLPHAVSFRDWVCRHCGTSYWHVARFQMSMKHKLAEAPYSYCEAYQSVLSLCRRRFRLQPPGQTLSRDPSVQLLRQERTRLERLSAEVGVSGCFGRTVGVSDCFGRTVGVSCCFGRTVDGVSCCCCFGRTAGVSDCFDRAGRVSGCSGRFGAAGVGFQGLRQGELRHTRPAAHTRAHHRRRCRSFVSFRSSSCQSTDAERDRHVGQR